MRGYDYVEMRGCKCDGCGAMLTGKAVASYEPSDEDGETQKVYCLKCGRKRIQEDIEPVIDLLCRISKELGEA